jgi:hypothetical protein
MGSYISSNDNRFYAALEPAYAQVGAMTAASRFPGVKLATKQAAEKVQRKDKTGSRTFAGLPQGIRRRTSYEVRTYMTAWTTPGQQPGYGPLFQAALGGSPLSFGGRQADGTSTPSTIHFTGAHGLAPGQALTYGDEIRFVAGVIDANAIQLAAPFTASPAGGQLGATITYRLAKELPSVSLFDYWDPSDAVHRIVTGAAVDRLRVKVNGDFQEFQFSGPAGDVIDSASFSTGEGALQEFPAEPQIDSAAYSVIPGHMGQAWVGSTPEQFFTVTEGEVLLENDVLLRDREFGASLARGISPGVRKVSINFSLYELNDAASKSLYQAARQRSPISVTLQLGQQAGQLFGIYLKSVVPEVPDFDDSDRRLQWSFVNCRAQGALDDELFVAFG